MWTPAKRRARRRLVLAGGIAVFCAIALPLLNRFTRHPGESVILLAPPALGALLRFGWPRFRRVPLRKYALYPVLLAPILAGAVALVAYMADGQVLWTEVVLALYFTIALRLAWTTWALTVGKVGEKWRRWGRRVRHRGQVTGDRGQGTAEEVRRQETEGRSKESEASRNGHRCRLHCSTFTSSTLSGHGPAGDRRRRLVAATMLIGPARFLLVAFVFAPLAFGSLVHRIKIGNPATPSQYPGMKPQAVTLHTDDGFALSGWFLPDLNSDATVVICHGAGANKNNFATFLTVFRYQGYNSLIFDFRGHGGSDGHTCTFGLYEDADVKAAVDWLKKEQPEKAKHVYGLGSSMGAMSLVRQAAKDPRIEAIVLDSCFTSAPLLARQHLGRIPLVGRLLEQVVLMSMSLHAGRSFWDLDASKAIAAISPRPVLLIAGDKDAMISPTNLDILYNLAREPKDKWLGPGPHSNIVTTDFESYQKRVIGFLDKMRATSPE